MTLSDLPLNPPGTPLYRDRNETKVASWIQPWDGREAADVLLIGAPLSKTSISHSGASGTPQAIREMLGSVSTYDFDHDIDLATVLTMRDAGDARVHVTDLARSRAGIRDAVAAVMTRSRDSITIVMGGDHSITAPSVEAFRSQSAGAVGLVQLDAHMDLRNLDDGGPSNGTPIRQLLESGTLEGGNIVQVGLQSFANSRAYRDVARAAGIAQISAREAAAESPQSVAHRALDIADAHCDAIYVTLDMDVLDQAYAPGVAALVPGGFTSPQLFEIMHTLGAHRRVRALDIVEVDPSQDVRRATVRVAVFAMLHFLSGVASRRDDS